MILWGMRPIVVGRIIMPSDYNDGVKFVIRIIPEAYRFKHVVNLH